MGPDPHGIHTVVTPDWRRIIAVAGYGWGGWPGARNVRGRSW